jgi:hypothetical protein
MCDPFDSCITLAGSILCVHVSRFPVSSNPHEQLEQTHRTNNTSDASRPFQNQRTGKNHGEGSTSTPFSDRKITLRVKPKEKKKKKPGADQNPETNMCSLHRREIMCRRCHAILGVTNRKNRCLSVLLNLRFETRAWGACGRQIQLQNTWDWCVCRRCLRAVARQPGPG